MLEFLGLGGYHAASELSMLIWSLAQVVFWESFQMWTDRLTRIPLVVGDLQQAVPEPWFDK